MKLVVGLGNPGREYEFTRHNLGFIAVKEFAKEHGLKFSKREFNSYYAKGHVEGNSVLSILPLTYMNLAGRAVSSFLAKYRCDASDLLVVCDDVALPLGALRLKAKGSAGGHNGLKSIIDSIGTDKFSRLRLGIGRSGDVKAHVLERFTKDELKQVKEVVRSASAVISEWLSSGVEKAMAKWNRRHNA